MGKKKYDISKSPWRITHCIAECVMCRWRNEDYMKAGRCAADHVRKTGHSVRVERAGSYTIVRRS